ncbi:MAG: DMT family transporter [Lentisphaerae bacterium]|nr:DMT family transporter [Lentisphaerota bacterium]
MKSSARTWGLISGAVAAAAYGLNPLFARPLYEFGLTPAMVLFYRFALAAVMLVPLLVVKRISFALNVREFFASVLGGALMVASSLCLYSAFNYMDVGLAMTLLFLYPVIVAVVMSTVYREKLSWSIVASIVLALGGLICVTLLGKGNNNSEVHITWQGIVLAIGSAVSYALYIVAVRKSAMSNLPSEKLTFYTVLLGAPFFLIFLHGGMDLKLPQELNAWLLLAGVAFFPTIIALALMAVAIDKVGATPTAILGVLEPLTGLLIGIIMYGERLTLFSSMGIVLIFAAVLLVIAGDRKKPDAQS